MTRAAVVFLPVIFLVSWAGTARAQIVRLPTPTPTPQPTASPTPTPEPKPLPCPRVHVQAQPPRARDGQPVSFTANIAGGDPKVTPMIVWNTTAGYITDGQNTRRIQVDSTDAGNTYDREIKAEVWVGGYAPECLLQASAVIKIIPRAAKFGDFGEVEPEVLTGHMKKLAGFLAESADNLYLIAYAGRNSERNFAMNWIRRIREQLVVAGVNPRRINSIDGGFREEPLFDFWIVPVGAEPPRAEPTVPRSEIVYPRTPPPKKPDR